MTDGGGSSVKFMERERERHEKSVVGVRIEA